MTRPGALLRAPFAARARAFLYLCAPCPAFQLSYIGLGALYIFRASLVTYMKIVFAAYIGPVQRGGVYGP